MTIKFNRKVFENHGSLFINIPKPVAEALDIKKGDSVIITYGNGSFSVIKSEKD